MTRKHRIGLIGAIGAGKSTAAAFLRTRGGAVIDADRVGHEVLDEPKVKAAVVARFGPVTHADGRIDRRALGAVVFGNAALRAALEEIVFPVIAVRVLQRFDAIETDPAARFAVLDAAVMLEAGWAGVVDTMLYIDAPRALRERRVAARSGWTAADLTAREAAQWPAERKMAKADAVVMNDGRPEELHARLDRVLAGRGLAPAERTA